MLRGGIVGLGRLGQRYVRLLTQDERTTVGGVYDLDAALTERIGRELGVHACRSLDELIEACKLDFLYVGTPDFAHLDATMRGVEAGLDVLVDKPLTTNLSDALKIRDAVNEAGVRCVTAFSNRYNPPFVAAKAAIDRGDIGAVRIFNGRLNDAIWVPTDMLSWAASSTPGWFLMSHVADVAQWLSDQRPVEVYGSQVVGRLQGLGVDTIDSLHANVTYDDGGHGFFESQWILPNGLTQAFDMKLDIVGTEGSIHIDSHYQAIQVVTDRTRNPGAFDIEINGRLLGQTAYLFQAFIDAIVADRAADISIDEGVANVRLIEAIHESAKERAPRRLEG
jgi:predicted dehydrogenase